MGGTCDALGALQGHYKGQSRVSHLGKCDFLRVALLEIKAHDNVFSKAALPNPWSTDDLWMARYMFQLNIVFFLVLITYCVFAFSTNVLFIMMFVYKTFSCYPNFSYTLQVLQMIFWSKFKKGS